MAPLRVGTFFLHPNIWWGGGEIAHLRVLQWLARRGVEAEVIVTRLDGPLPFRLTNSVALTNLQVPTLRWRGKPVGTAVALGALFGLARYYRHSPPHAIITLGWAGGGLTLWARRLADAPTKVCIWEQTHVSAMQRQGGNLYRRGATQWVRFSYCMADAVVGCSRSVAEDVARLANLPPSRVRTIYNPLPPDLFERADEPVDHPWFADPTCPIILSVARLDPLKDFPTLLRAFALLRQHRKVRLVILGEGPERPKLERLRDELGLRGEVDLPGFVDNPFKFMKRARLSVLSSRLEGSPLVLAEALALGCPVVATDCVSGPAEILEGGKYGRLVAVGDVKGLAAAMEAALEEEPDREALKARGMDFHIDRIGQQWLKLLETVCR